MSVARSSLLPSTMAAGASPLIDAARHDGRRPVDGGCGFRATVHRDNRGDLGNRGAEAENLLDHLRPVGRDHFRARVADDVRSFLDAAGRVERHDDRAEPEHCLIDDDPFGAIVREDGDAIAGAHAEAQQSGAQLSGGLGNVGPRMVGPDFVALVLQERARTVLLGLRLEVLRKGRHAIRHKEPRPPLPRLVVAQSFVAANRATASDFRWRGPAIPRLRSA